MRKLFIVVLLLSLAAAAQADLSAIGVTPLDLLGGARYLGLGGAASAIAYNADAIFSNPGALDRAKGVFLNVKDMGNIAAGQSYPTGNGQTISIAFYKSGADGIRTAASTSEYSISDNILILSAGARLSSLPQFANNELAKNLGVGINLKILTGQTLGQTGIPDRTARGMDADLGILYYDRKWLSAGAWILNAIPSSGGEIGSLAWNDGQKEGIPRILKLGGAARVAGESGSPLYWQGNQLLLSADLEMKQRSLLHLGIEWSSPSNLSLRAGIAQRVRNDKVESDPSLGAGLRFSDWALDASYAKDPLKGSGSIYLSLTYFPGNWFFLAKPIDEISLDTQIDTKNTKTDITGRVKPGTLVFINSASVEVAPDGSFSYKLPLNAGDNPVQVETVYEGERQVKTYNMFRRPPPILPTDRISVYEDQTVFEKDLDLSGKLADGVTAVTVNGQTYQTNENGEFAARLPLKMGKNVIKVEGQFGDQLISKTYVIYRKPPPKLPPEREQVEAPIEGRVLTEEDMIQKREQTRTMRQKAAEQAKVVAKQNKIEQKKKAIEKEKRLATQAQVLLIGGKGARFTPTRELIKIVELNPQKYSLDKKTGIFKVKGVLSENESKVLASCFTDPNDIQTVSKLYEYSQIKERVRRGEMPPASYEAPAELQQPGFEQKYKLSPKEMYARIKIAREREQNIIKFGRLQQLILEYTNVRIVKKAKIKLPLGYFSVYVTTKDTYVAMKHVGGGKVAVEHYNAATGKWTLLSYVPYSKIKDLI